GFVLCFVAKLSFDTIQFGANLIGNFMGFATANYYDPHQESQTQVVAEFHMALAILIFLALDGHHFMLRSVLNSYQIVGLGKAEITGALGQKLIEQTTQVILFGVQLAAPMAISLFAVNIVFGVLAKSMPQLNILVLSFSVSILVGFLVLLLGITDFQVAAGNILERMNDSLQEAMMAMKY
ncbi:MAG: flagellar biosynthetic protein FliR, partial [Bdellovibrio sp.]|nr:flagellar biosynthetic protein FliR [Bdellovibrio sp.]